jgi:hypothetical protein
MFRLWSIIFACALGACPAFANRFEELRVGASVQSVGPVAPNVEKGGAVAGEILFIPVDLEFLGSPMPHIGGSIALNDQATSFGYAGLTWRADLTRRAYFDFGVGGAVHDGRTSFDPTTDFPRRGSAFLGCRALFRLHVSPGVRVGERYSIGLQWEHLSNANLCRENEGLDNWGIRFGLQL